MPPEIRTSFLCPLSFATPWIRGTKLWGSTLGVCRCPLSLANAHSANPFCKPLRFMNQSYLRGANGVSWRRAALLAEMSQCALLVTSPLRWPPWPLQNIWPCLPDSERGQESQSLSRASWHNLLFACQAISADCGDAWPCNPQNLKLVGLNKHCAAKGWSPKDSQIKYFGKRCRAIFPETFPRSRKSHPRSRKSQKEDQQKRGNGRTAA